MTKQPWNKRIALISGGLGGIGQALARALLERGARVAICDLAPSAPCELAAPGLHYQQVDIRDHAAVERWVETIESELGCPDIAVLNAAVVEFGSACESSPEIWRKSLEVNLEGAVNLAQASARRMRAHGIHGHIVAIGSWAGHAPHSNLAAYSVTKAALRMFCQCLALELAPDGIRVNEIAPGYVDAGLSARVWQADPAARARQTAQVPLGEVIPPEDVARALIHLCEGDFPHATGSVLLMDGGLSLLQGPR
jgi:NAD(P)-dependent dehydrogenase (short-subunit alcohol dehydrogenase family)